MPGRPWDTTSTIPIVCQEPVAFIVIVLCRHLASVVAHSTPFPGRRFDIDRADVVLTSIRPACRVARRVRAGRGMVPAYEYLCGCKAPCSGIRMAGKGRTQTQPKTLAAAGFAPRGWRVPAPVDRNEECAGGTVLAFPGASQRLASAFDRNSRWQKRHALPLPSTAAPSR